jgi:cytoskeletal protein RodZ
MAALTAVLVLFLPVAPAVAQVSVDPTVTPELNTGGWVHGMAILLGILGLIVILLVVVAFVRFAPRFSTDDTTFKIVRADRVRPGEELPRRTVDIKEAAPVVVAPPPLPERAGVAAAAAPVAAPAAPAPAAAPAAGAPATAPAEQAPAPPAQAGPGAETPSEEAPRGEPSSEGPPSEEAPAARETPAAQAAAPAAAPAPTEHVEVTMDQEVYEQTLQELLAKGTDKRVAEGQARRAGMIAARKKAAGG